MSLDGLRAWIAEVERKLAKRTRVFLALSVIAIGIAGAAVYLAIDARESSVSESDVQTLQDELEARGGAVPSADVSTLEAEVQALQDEVEQLKGGQGGSGGGEKKDSGTSGTGTGSNSDGGVSADGASSDNEAELKDLLEKAQEQNADSE